jgi:hypothetical protein
MPLIIIASVQYRLKKRAAGILRRHSTIGHISPAQYENPQLLNDVPKSRGTPHRENHYPGGMLPLTSRYDPQLISSQS